MNKIDKVLKQLRELKGCSKAKIAQAINVSRGTIDRIERGSTDIRMQTLIKIAIFFDVSCKYLLGRTRDNKK